MNLEKIVHHGAHGDTARFKTESRSGFRRVAVFAVVISGLQS